MQLTQYVTAYSHSLTSFLMKFKICDEQCFLIAIPGCHGLIIMTLTYLSSQHIGQWQWWHWQHWQRQWWAPRNACSRTDPPCAQLNCRLENDYFGFENCKYQCYCNTKKNNERAEEVGEEEEGGEEDAGKSDPEVAEQLLRDHLVGLPVAVLLAELYQNGYWKWQTSQSKLYFVTWVRAKTLPEKLQSAIMSFTLFRAGMCSPLP